MKEWLAEQRTPRQHHRLQSLLDHFREHYNQDRPHQGLDDATPAERYQP
jgi:transposase InsO family protein